jgi:uncharacterized protein YjiS (DUF1127 family)
MILPLGARTSSGPLSSPVLPDRQWSAPGKRSVLQWILQALRRRRSRLSITELNDAMLRDIGATRADAEYEANKAFWRA